MSGDLSLSWSKMCNFFFSEDFCYPNKEYSLNVVDVFYDFRGQTFLIEYTRPAIGPYGVINSETIHITISLHFRKMVFT